MHIVRPLPTLPRLRGRVGRGRVVAAVFVIAAIGWSLPAPAIDAAAQDGPARAAPANAVPCDAFKKNPDGSWTALRAVTVKMNSSRVGVGANTAFGRHAIEANGVDFAAFLDSHCSAK